MSAEILELFEEIEKELCLEEMLLERIYTYDGESTKFWQEMDVSKELIERYDDTIEFYLRFKNILKFACEIEMDYKIPISYMENLLKLMSKDQIIEDSERINNLVHTEEPTKDLFEELEILLDEIDDFDEEAELVVAKFDFSFEAFIMWHKYQLAFFTFMALNENKLFEHCYQSAYEYYYKMRRMGEVVRNGEIHKIEIKME